MKKVMTLMLAMCIAMCMSAQTGKWVPFKNAPDNYQGVTMKTDKKGDFYFASRDYLVIGGQGYGGIARWNDTTWTSVGNLTADSKITDFAFDSKGNIYACGLLSMKNANGTSVSMSVGKWDGKIWTSLAGYVIPMPFTIAVSPTDEVYVGGEFPDMNNVADTKFIAKWDGKLWSSVAKDGVSANIGQIEIDNTGKVYIRGDFKKTGTGVVLNRLAVLNAGKWDPLDGGYSGTAFQPLIDMAFDSKNNLWVGGRFDSMGSTDANYLAYWNGTAWIKPTTTTVDYVTNIVFDEKNMPIVSTGSGGSAKMYSIQNKAYSLIAKHPNNIDFLYYDKVKKRIYTVGSFTSPSKNLAYYQFDTTISNNDLAAVSNLALYPNPSTDRVTIDFKNTLPTATTMKVWSIMGALLSTQTLESGISNTTLDVSTLNAGTYLLQFTNEKGEQYSKAFVKG